MSKAEIIGQLPKLKPNERREILDRICELEEQDLLNGVGPTSEERALLDREFEDYRRNPEARSTWEEVEARLGKPSPQ